MNGDDWRSLPPADAGELAALHSLCFDPADAWAGSAFAGSLEQPEIFGTQVRIGGRLAAFLLGRVVADQAEIITLAVSPAFRRRHLALKLVRVFLQEAFARGAGQVFLEVAADNNAAQALYAGLGFEPVGVRSGYYPSGRSAKVLALSLRPPPEGGLPA